MKKSTELVVALDFNNVAEAEDMISQLNGLPIIYKIGLELFAAAGSEWVKKLTQSGVRVFLDLKLHDIPNTVAKTILQINEMNVEFTTVHLFGGRKMLDMIQEQLPVDSKLKILGVSILTSFLEEEWISNVSMVAKLGSARTIHDSVLHFGIVVDEHPAVGGMICSPLEVEALKEKFPDIYLMVPGIRPTGFMKDDQERVTTPLEASRAGASAIVVGRQITHSTNSRLMTEQILNELI